MILKSFNLEKVDFNQFNIILLYGENAGYKEEVLKKINKQQESISRYEEKDILKDVSAFYESISSQSFFEKAKTIIVYNSTDKILNVFKEINEKNYKDTKIISVSGILEKKSKLRNYFEKDKNLACIAFYPDDTKTLLSQANFFLRNKKISISQEVLNKIISRSNGDRKNLNNELLKIENYCLNKKTINSEEIDKLTNMSENNNITELVDNCLAKNNKKLNFLINENNFISEDVILIIRTFLIKAKRLLSLRKEYELNKNIDKTILNFRPPIFWKDKEIVQKQLKQWTVSQIEKLLMEINDVELLIKKNSQNSTIILSDFIINNSRISN